MSVLDELKAMEQQVVDRLQELEPAVAEYEELRRVAERLGLDYRATAPSRTTASTGRRRSSTGRRSSRAAAPARAAGTGRRRSGPKGQRAEQVLGAVRKQPGITVPEIGQQLGIDYTGLYRVVRQLEKEGRIAKQGKQLQPA